MGIDLQGTFEVGGRMSFRRPQLKIRSVGDPVRPFGVLVSKDGASAPGAFCATVSPEILFRCTYEEPGWHPLVLFVTSDAEWLVVDDVLRHLADDDFYMHGLPYIFSAWSEWKAALP